MELRSKGRGVSDKGGAVGCGRNPTNMVLWQHVVGEGKEKQRTRCRARASKCDEVQRESGGCAMARVSQQHCNKSPPKLTTCLPLPEARSLTGLNSRGWQGRLPWRSPRGGRVPSLFHSWRHLHPLAQGPRSPFKPPANVSLGLCPWRTPVITLGPHTIWDPRGPSLITPAKQAKVHGNCLYESL